MKLNRLSIVTQSARGRPGFDLGPLGPTPNPALGAIPVGARLSSEPERSLQSWRTDGTRPGRGGKS